MSMPTRSPASNGTLVASANLELRTAAVRTLAFAGSRAGEANGGAEALASLERGEWKQVLLDRHLPDLDAEEVAALIRVRHPGVEVTLLEEQAAAAPRAVPVGVPARVTLAPEVRMVVGAPALAVAGDVEPLPGMIGRAPAMQRLYRLARLVAARTTTVLLTGPTGTGKEIVARALHQISPRAHRPFVVVNCAAIPETLLESELFGHVRGAFTGAVQAQIGRIHAAQGGTLFFDEVGELPTALQAKLLRFLEQKEVQRLGSPEVVRVDVRVIAATNADLATRVRERRFRDDLYYRLAAFPLELPALGERREDVLALACHFLEKLAAGANTPVPGLSHEAARQLQNHPWHGNVRELQLVMERASILCQGGRRIETDHLHFLPSNWAEPARKDDTLGSFS
jgi:DNA-binding NtrC family response regulator